MSNKKRFLGETYWATDDEVALIEATGAHDCSYQNNIAPSWALESDESFELFVDAINPDDREDISNPRFTVLDSDGKTHYAGESIVLALTKLLESSARTFKRTWGEGYVDATDENPKVDTCFLGEMSADCGYDATARQAVADLEVGEVANLSDFSGDHFVERVT
tara:strand:+ start:2240 stop:2731 length:492 start_codon:yes stop_codon:yes gene_type:complete